MIDLEMYSINLPGRIIKYYPEDQTADILVCAELVYSNAEELQALADRSNLVRVPVHTPSGGGWSMTMPIKAGNTCMILFSQIGYDHWFYSDKDKGGKLLNSPVPHLLREFDEADAYALVGFNTLPRKIIDYQADDAEFRNIDRDQRISLKANGEVLIKTGSTTITMTKDGDVVVDTDTEVQVNCTTSVVNASASADITTAIATVTAPTINLAASATVLATTPVFSITGNLLVGGGIGGGGAAAPAGGGLEVTGASKITGALVTTSTVTASDVISGGKSVNGHTHTNPEGGSTGPF